MKSSSEARAGFEPANEGFADLAIGPLWYRAKHVLHSTKTLAVANWELTDSTIEVNSDWDYYAQGKE
jgi:hypothetical protein